MHQSLPSFSSQLLQHAPIAEGIIELSLMIPANFSWQAGDYLWLSANMTDFKPFSIASLPDEPNLRLQIALVPTLETWLSQLLKSSSCYIKGPVHQYQWPAGHDPILLLAGGTGITPLLSLLKTHLADDKQRPVKLIWGVRQAELLFAKDELNRLATEYKQFAWQGVVSIPDTSWQGPEGNLPDFISQQPALLEKNTHVLICGPWPMVQAIKQLTASVGIAPDTIQ